MGVFLPVKTVCVLVNRGYKKLLTMSNERCILHALKDSDASEPVPGAVSFTNLQAFESGQVMRGTHLQRVRGS